MLVKLYDTAFTHFVSELIQLISVESQQSDLLMRVKSLTSTSILVVDDYYSHDSH